MNLSAKIRPSLPADIPAIMAMEAGNRRFVSCYNENKHRELMEKKDFLHMSLFNQSGLLVGFFILAGIESPNRNLEFRRIAIDEKGRGHGKAALRYIKEFCFNELKFHRLWLDVFDDNVRAIGLYESEGFRQEALLKENVRSGDEYRSQRIYAMLEEEYKQLQENSMNKPNS